MRIRLRAVAIGVMLAVTCSGNSAEEVKVEDLQKKTPVYYATASGKPKVRLSDEMAAKVIAIIARKPKPFTRIGGPRAAPRGQFLVGKQAYDYYSFLYFEISNDPSWGYTWDDEALAKFWKELNKVNDEVDKLKDFKP